MLCYLAVKSFCPPGSRSPLLLLPGGEVVLMIDPHLGVSSAAVSSLQGVHVRHWGSARAALLDRVQLTSDGRLLPEPLQLPVTADRYRSTEGQTQTYRETDRQVDRHTDKEVGRQTDRQTNLLPDPSSWRSERIDIGQQRDRYT